jgi:hypothetical protein
MNNLKGIAVIALLLLLTSCINQRSANSRDRDYTSAELIGKWKQVNTDESINKTNPKIDYIQLINDSAAEVQLVDTTGVRKVNAKWEKAYKKEIKSFIKFESDIKISFPTSDRSSQTLLLQLEEENKKTIMTTYSYKFEKE